MNLHKLWDIDPGYFRLKHAFKTIIAILIPLGLMRHEPTFVKAMVGLASGFSMQGVVAKAYPARIIQAFVLDLAYFVAFLLGLLVRDSVIGSSVMLVSMGFFVNYVRRFGLQTSVAPMMAWTLCFFATILPFSNTAEVWQHIHGLIIALVVSFFVNILIFPENYPRLFVWNSNRIFHVLAHGMSEIRAYVLNANKGMVFERLAFVRTRDRLVRLLESNQAIDQSGVFSDVDNATSELLFQQYALVHAYAMMIDAYHVLCRHQQQLLQPVQEELAIIYKQFEMLFSSLKMCSDYSVVSGESTVFLPSLAQKFSRTPLTEPATVIVLLNLKLSFNLLKRHVAKMLRIADAT